MNNRSPRHSLLVRRPYRLFIAILAVLLLSPAIGGCGGMMRGLLGLPETGAVPGTAVAPAARPPGDGRPMGGVLRIAGSLPPTLDPAMAQDSTSAEYIVHLFSGLVRLNADLEVVPDLAEGWEVSGDGRAYAFTLREGITFADGRPITAEDVVYSIERACSPALGSPIAASYLSDIVGVAEFAAGRAESIEGLTIVAPDRVEIAIDAPKAYFLAKLTYPAAFVVDGTQIARDGTRWTQRPNGSGPFVLETLSLQRIVLARNVNYHGPAPALDRVEYLIDGGFPITMYENDQLDLVSVPPSEIERMTDPENPLHAELHSASGLSVNYLAFDVTVPPFDDLLVRQAIAMAVDRQRLADLVLRGSAVAAVGILPPAMPDFAELEGLPYDPEEARQRLATSRYGADGQMPELVLAISGTSGHLDGLTEAILSMLERNLGLDVIAHQVDWPDFLDDLNARRYPMYLSGWIADYPDSENFLDLLFHSRSAQNHTGYANSEVDRLLAEARVEGDPEARTRLYQQVEALIVADAPWVPLVHGREITLVKPYVRGFGAAAAIYPWLADIYIDRA